MSECGGWAKGRRPLGTRPLGALHLGRGSRLRLIRSQSLAHVRWLAGGFGHRLQAFTGGSCCGHVCQFCGNRMFSPERGFVIRLALPWLWGRGREEETQRPQSLACAAGRRGSGPLSSPLPPSLQARQCWLGSLGRQ